MTETELYDRPLPANLDCERFILGSILINGECFDKVAAILDPADFLLEKHKRIFHRMTEIAHSGERIDRVTLANALMKAGQLESVEGFEYLVSLDQDLPRIENIESYIRIVQDKSTKRRAIMAYQQAIDELMLDAEDAPELLEKSEHMISALRADRKDGGFKTPMQVIDEAGGVDAFLSPRTLAGIPTPWHGLNLMLTGGGFSPGQLVVVGGRPGAGKAQPLDSPVLGPHGEWFKIGDLKIGDRIAGPCGGSAKVFGVFPQGRKPVFRVTFSDGRSTLCCAEHLWSVRHRHWQENRILDTKTIAAKLTRKRYQSRLSIPVSTGPKSKPAMLSVDPWLLGYLLGNGSTRTGSPKVTCPDPVLVEKLHSLFDIGSGLQLKHEKNFDYVVTQIGGQRHPGQKGVRLNPLTQRLKALGAYGSLSFDKTIPENYMRGDREQRLELLRGLLDSDGTIGKTGSVSFSSASEKLARGVRDLARSVGCLSFYRKRKTPQYTHKGLKKNGRDSFIVSIRATTDDPLFYHPMKAERFARRIASAPTLNFVSVEPAGEAECVCIQTSHPSHLYVTDEYICTHNTGIAANIAVGCVQKWLRCAYVSLEMTSADMLRRMICSRASVNLKKLSHMESAPMEREYIAEALDELAAPDHPGLLMWKNQTASVLALRAELRREAAKAPIAMVVVDYLQLMESVSGKRDQNRNNEISDMSRGLKLLAMELKCVVIVLSQLSRDSEKQERRPKLSDLRDSGAIEADADIVLFPYTQPVEVMPDVQDYELIIAKQRNGPVGMVPMAFIRRFIRFDER